MDKVKILVAQHKEYDCPSNDVYMPVHVGKKISTINLGIQGDDKGDNISELNPFFCELTAQYWGWKNLDCEYIGLCHYRRYFEKEITLKNIDSLMSDCDVILSRRIYIRPSILNFLSSALIPEDIAMFNYYMEKRFSEHLDIYLKYYNSVNILHPANMFICKKETFDKFAEWQFEILFDLYKLIPYSNHTRERRLMGYFAETLWGFYACLKEMPLVEKLGGTDRLLQTGKKEILRWEITKWRSSTEPKHYNLDPAIHISLQNDGYYERIDCYLKDKYNI